MTVRWRQAVLSVLVGLAALIPLPAAAKTLVFCSEGSPETLNPQLAVTGTAMDAAHPMFNTLVEYAIGTTNIRPALAESWTISPDGRTYTFRLRENVRFHANDVFTPTRPLTAEDVVFSIERQWKGDHPFHEPVGGTFDYFRDTGMEDLLEAVEALDERTVRIRLTRPEAPFLADLALPFASVLSAEYAQTLQRIGRPELLDTRPIGTGPYMLVDYRPDVALRYRVFPDYWRGRQVIDTLVFSITPSPTARLAKLQGGECHISAFPTPEDAETVRANRDLRLYTAEGLNIGYLAMNTTRPPFDDVRVRRALNAAIDKASIIASVYGATGTEATNPMPPTMWGYNAEIPPFPHDLAEARRLMTEAGLTKGISLDLWYPPINRPYLPDGRRVAELVASDLGRIGIEVELKTMPWAEYRQAMQDGDFSLALFGWFADIGDPDNFLHTLLGCPAARTGGNNVARWCNPAFNALVTQAKVSSDVARRSALYEEAQVLFHEDVPWVPIAHANFMVATRAEVTGFTIDPLGYHIVENVDIVPGPVN
ncbi:ABC transporter substrate-binding protein [Antarcticirhabdus aurantiaca]|uniref:ABC transporter substrate-binding protein n=1 Tax=Antarcticirhabdus aurantiaca TaxID=2606717 RepID=A0ACD4NRR4_9HYPH|nr:ABC transporter substrate-binding protein [Antarcticirhabdus aurantiaca]WAJ29603.1 ABC transporter substrate-binding protein [Jeongeuplla avenae]